MERLQLGFSVQNAGSAPPGRRAGAVPFREQRSLQAAGRVGLDPVGGGPGAGVAEQVGGAVGHRQQADHALGLRDDAPGPALQVDAHRLREAAHHVERQVEPRRCGRFVLGGVRRRAAAGVGGLQGPEEQGGEAGVFFQRAGHAVAGARFGGAEHGFERGAAHYLHTRSRYSESGTVRPAGVSTARYWL